MNEWFLLPTLIPVVLERFPVIARGGRDSEVGGCSITLYVHSKDFSFNYKIHLSSYLLSDQTLNFILDLSFYSFKR